MNITKTTSGQAGNNQPGLARRYLWTLSGLYLLLGATGASAADVHVWRDASGVLHFSDYPPADGAAAQVLEIPASNPPDYDATAEYAQRMARWDAWLEIPGAAGYPSASPPAPTPLVSEPAPAAQVLVVRERWPLSPLLPANHHPPPPAPQQLPQAHVPKALEDLARSAHPARSFRRPGADQRYGVLGSRVTHRRETPLESTD